MKIAAVVQARMGSTRLPGKVLAEVCGMPLIKLIIQRVRAASTVNAIIVATTTDAEDDQLVAALGQQPQCEVFRGERDDVLDRFYRCAAHHKVDVVVRVTADDPLKDPRIIDRAVQQLLDEPSLDYSSNTLQPTFPEGLDIEAVRFCALSRAHAEAKLPSEREHVTPYIWKHPELFRVCNFSYPRDLSSWRWTVDRPRDLEFVRTVYQHFGNNALVSFEDVIGWLESNPAVRAINEGPLRNEGYLSSLNVEQEQ